MKEIKNVVICGLGAIGSIYAVKISEQKSINLKIAVDEQRLPKYLQNPLIFNGKEYCFDYISGKNEDFSADLIIIATKSSGLSKALEEISSFINENTIIISLLNGLESEEIIAEKFGQEKVLYSYYIGHTSTRKDRSITHDGVYKTVFGEKNNKSYSFNVLCLKDFFEKCSIPFEIPEDMDYSRWWKFLVNVGYNQASAVLNASYGDFQKSKKVNDFAVKLMMEAVQIAAAAGIKNTEKLIPEVLKTIETMLPETRTSMLQDIDAKRQTEVDIFAGYVSRLGKKYGIKTPYNDIVFEIIKAMDEKNFLKNN